MSQPQHPPKAGSAAFRLGGEFSGARAFSVSPWVLSCFMHSRSAAHGRRRILPSSRLQRSMVGTGSRLGRAASGRGRSNPAHQIRGRGVISMLSSRVCLRSASAAKPLEYPHFTRRAVSRSHPSRLPPMPTTGWSVVGGRRAQGARRAERQRRTTRTLESNEQAQRRDRRPPTTLYRLSIRRLTPSSAMTRSMSSISIGTQSDRFS